MVDFEGGKSGEVRSWLVFEGILGWLVRVACEKVLFGFVGDT